VPTPGLYTIHAAPVDDEAKLSSWRIRVTRNEDGATVMQKDDCLSPVGGMNLAGRAIIEDRMSRGKGI
jgi:hypothetical protein